MELSARDYKILGNLGKWHFLIASHIEFLAGFPSSRTMYRRLKVLIKEKLIEKQKILYGVPSLYTLAHKGLILLSLNKRKDKIRIELLKHNIHVIDTLIYLMKNKVITDLESVKSEKELNRKNGFSKRTHQPDFVFFKDNKTYCVEVELSLKSTETLEKNLKDNFLKYDNQIWVVEKRNNKIERNIKSLMNKYSDINILCLEEFLI
ncbi:MAG: hypothetical protein FWF46_00395 [Oscillospiraceae bacterium]|nr:hypothetical protein [Oscillospiraceae bacterium]